MRRWLAAAVLGPRLRLGPWEPVGGHTRAVLAELGRGDAEIERLIAGGVVEAWSPEDGG